MRIKFLIVVVFFCLVFLNILKFTYAVTKGER